MKFPRFMVAIETSCDETGVSVLEGIDSNTLRVCGNALASQIDLHAKYGGVFPAMAKRAHTEKIVTLLGEALEQAGMLIAGTTPISEETKGNVQATCSHEAGLADQLIAFVESYAIPDIECIGVTAGPGLEPALWVGINAARALGELWQKPVYPVNHMEGHIVSAIWKQDVDDQKTFRAATLEYPALSLLVSGGHTELVLMEEPFSYRKIGQTKDDAVGEAFDKVARMLELPYPGGPKISALAADARAQNLGRDFELPRPMLHPLNRMDQYHFSYSGLKTAVFYLIRDMEKHTPGALKNDEIKMKIAREFEDAAIEVLVSKTRTAIQEFNIRTLIVGGGVAANTYLRDQIAQKIGASVPAGLAVTVLFPTRELSTDNSIMIGMVLYSHLLEGRLAELTTDNEKSAFNILKADGNLSL